MNNRKCNVIATVLLTLVISISGCITAFAGEPTSTAEGQLTSTIYWSISGDVLTISGTGAMPDYRSPWEYYRFSRVDIEYGITSIGDCAFNDCSSLTSIKIPDSVTSIGSNAFCDCSSLTSINIPETVTSIGYYTFSGCSSLTSINIPESVTSIENYTFSGCSSLESISIPETVTMTSIGYGAFWGCSSLESITIPESVTSIGESAFSGCSSLTSINIPESLTSIESYTFSGCSSLESISIPETVTMTSIGYGAFRNCSSLTSIKIPESLTSIESSTFYGCSSLTSINIPESVTDIGESAFADCSSLTSINIPDSVTSIGERAFRSCSSLESITIPETVTSIGESAFSGCSSLESILIPETVTSIGDNAFGYCTSLTSINIPESLTSIGNQAFYNCISLESISIPETVTSIGDSAFGNCTSLTSINIPESVTSIGESAFGGCSSLESITIPESVTSIGEYAFAYSSKLKKLEILGESRIGPCIFGKRYDYEKKISLFINPKAKMSIKEAIDNPNIDIYTSASSFPDNWGTYSDNLRVKIIYNTNLDTFRRLMAKGHNYQTTTIKATASNNGSIVTKCSVCGDVKDTTTIYYPKTMKLQETTYTYNGGVKNPAVSIVDANGNTVSSDNYSVFYASGRKSVGKYKVTVTFKGDKYSGSKYTEFYINPKGTSISKLYRAKKAFTVKWKKQPAKMATSTITGYQIRYSTSSKMTSPKYKTVKGYKYTSKKITKLKAKKKYYVQVRTYKTVSGKNYYSSWSGMKSVTTK